MKLYTYHRVNRRELVAIKELFLEQPTSEQLKLQRDHTVFAHAA